LSLCATIPNSPRQSHTTHFVVFAHNTAVYALNSVTHGYFSVVCQFVYSFIKKADLYLFHISKNTACKKGAVLRVLKINCLKLNEI